MFDGMYDASFKLRFWLPTNILQNSIPKIWDFYSSLFHKGRFSIIFEDKRFSSGRTTMRNRYSHNSVYVLRLNLSVPTFCNIFLHSAVEWTFLWIARWDRLVFELPASAVGRSPYVELNGTKINKHYREGNLVINIHIILYFVSAILWTFKVLKAF